MGYLNKATITVDAILTNRGRELLADGGDDFVVTKFAVADDEIDYRLYNLNHPNGRFGAIIENMPMLEATPDETQALRYKLVTYTGAAPTSTVVIPRITFSGATIGTGANQLSLQPVTGKSRTLTLSPRTTYTEGAGTGNTVTGAESAYVVVVSNGNIVRVRKDTPAPVTENVNPNSRGSITATGTQFTLTANTIGQTAVSVYGIDTGAVFNFLLQVIA
jgi:hypothetical protein